MKCCALTSTPEEWETEAFVIVFVCVCVLCAGRQRQTSTCAITVRPRSRFTETSLQEQTGDDLSKSVTQLYSCNLNNISV